jgi:hypothetical protein
MRRERSVWALRGANDKRLKDMGGGLHTMLVEQDAVVYYQLLRSALDLNLVRRSRDASRNFDVKNTRSWRLACSQGLHVLIWSWLCILVTSPRFVLCLFQKQVTKI